MTDSSNPFEKGQLRLEATEWFVLMRGPDAEQHRHAFEQWLARGALHRAAYNRVANIYSAGKQVNWDALPKGRPVRGTLRRTKIAALTCLTIVGFISWRLVVSPGTLPEKSANRPVASSMVPAAAYRTGPRESRRVGLSDGSFLTLDRDTLVLVEFGAGRRSLRLEHGRARFSVAHEARPFVVAAGSSQVVARGTVFDVSYNASGTTQVQLLQGAIDVSSISRGRALSMVRLRPGDKVRYRDDAPPGTVMALHPSDVSWTSAPLEFQRAPLRQVVEIANRASDVRIVIADNALGEALVSGTFRIDDPRQLARSLSMLLGLDVQEKGGTITLAAKMK